MVRAPQQGLRDGQPNSYPYPYRYPYPYPVSTPVPTNTLTPTPTPTPDQDYATADAIRAQLRAEGVEPDELADEVQG